MLMLCVSVWLLCINSSGFGHVMKLTRQVLLLLLLLLGRMSP